MNEHKQLFNFVLSSCCCITTMNGELIFDTKWTFADALKGIDRLSKAEKVMPILIKWIVFPTIHIIKPIIKKL